MANDRFTCYFHDCTAEATRVVQFKRSIEGIVCAYCEAHCEEIRRKGQLDIMGIRIIEAVGAVRRTSTRQPCPTHFAKGK